jgi:hypothetical protein
MTARHQPAAGDSTADGLVRASEADIDVLSQVIADAVPRPRAMPLADRRPHGPP